MITYRLERLRQPAQDALTAMLNLRSLAVQDFAGAGHYSAERFSDRLVSQTNAEDRCLSGEVPDDRHAYSCVTRRTWAGCDDDLVRRHHIDVFDRSFFLSHDFTDRSK